MSAPDVFVYFITAAVGVAVLIAFVTGWGWVNRLASGKENEG